MNVLVHLAAGAVAGGIAAATVVLVAAPGGSNATMAVDDDQRAALVALESKLAQMEATLASGDQRLEQLESSVESRLASISRQPLVAAQEATSANTADGPAASTATAMAAQEESVTVEGLMEQLLNADGEYDTAALWKQAQDAGLTDDLVAAFEARAAADPDNPDAHVELGGAYIQKIQEVGNGPLAGLWATKADEAFDQALALDEGHWGARMSKAVSLSFWPPIFGKQAEAVSQFEVLIEKQKDMPLEPGHESPYVLLGNLHWQRGDTEAAMAVWNEGLGLFPDSTDLAAALANNGD